MPQLKGSQTAYTTGNIYAVGIATSSLQPTAAYAGLYALTAPEVAFKFAEGLSLPPADRTLLSSKPETTYAPVFYNSALYTHAWLDPNAEKTNISFTNMVGDISSGRLPPESALAKLQREINAIINP